MRIELPAVPPESIKEQWPGQFSVFSYYAFVIDVPAPVFIITTLKENGLCVVTEFMPISARFIANKASWQFKNEALQEMLQKLGEVVKK